MAADDTGHPAPPGDSGPAPATAPSPTRGSSPLDGLARWPLRVAGLVLASRAFLIALLYALLGGREIAGDTAMHFDMVRHPLYLLAATRPRHGQHPPLLGLAEAVVVAPLRLVLPDFVALRLGFAAWEALAAGLVAWAAIAITSRSSGPGPSGPGSPFRARDPAARRALLWLLLLAPAGWMTTAVMCQDEVVAGAFVAAALALALRGRDRAALLVCGLGVATAKIFLLVPLLALVVLLRRPSLPRRVAWGFGPMILIYAWCAILARMVGHRPPLVGFSPAADFGTNVWVFLSARLSVAPGLARRVSGLLALGLGCAPLGLRWWRRRAAEAHGAGSSGAAGHGAGIWAASPRDDLDLIASTAAMLGWVFVAFYHVNPEYYALVLPATALLVRRRWEWWLVVVATALPWAVNLFFGIGHALATGADDGRSSVVALYQRLVPVAPQVLADGSLLLAVAATTGLAIWATHRLLGPTGLAPTGLGPTGLGPGAGTGAEATVSPPGQPRR